MGLAHSPKIVTENLKFCTDLGNIKSYSGTGSTQTELITGFTSVNGTDYSGNSFNSLSGFTGFCVLDILGTDTSYAYHPVSRWNSGTIDATFVLYHFQQYIDNVNTNNLSWYGNAGGTWTNLSSAVYDSTVGRYMSVIQYNSSTGGQHWINGNKVGSRGAARGVLGSGSGTIVIDGHVTGRTNIHKVMFTALYDRELTDSEIQQNFNALRGRYGL